MSPLHSEASWGKTKLLWLHSHSTAPISLLHKIVLVPKLKVKNTPIWVIRGNTWTNPTGTNQEFFKIMHEMLGRMELVMVNYICLTLCHLIMPGTFPTDVTYSIRLKLLLNTHSKVFLCHVCNCWLIDTISSTICTHAVTYLHNKFQLPKSKGSFVTITQVKAREKCYINITLMTIYVIVYHFRTVYKVPTVLNSPVIMLLMTRFLGDLSYWVMQKHTNSFKSFSQEGYWQHGELPRLSLLRKKGRQNPSGQYPFGLLM